MDDRKREALEADGWAFGSAEDFLELTPDERAEAEHRFKAIFAWTDRDGTGHTEEVEVAGVSRPGGGTEFSMVPPVAMEPGTAGLLTIVRTTADDR